MLDARIAQGARSFAPDSPQDSMMRALQLIGAQRQNALQQMQMQAYGEDRQAKQAQQQNALAMQNQQRNYLGAVDSSQGPAMPFSLPRALALGMPVEQAKALETQMNPQPKFGSAGPGTSVYDERTGQTKFTVPFKPTEPELPPIAKLQSYRDSLPPGDPRRREVEALIGNQTRPPKYAMPAAPGGMPAPAGMPPPGAAQPEGDDRSELAKRLGVPIAERDPYAGMSPKSAEVFKRSLYTAADKKLNEFAEASQSARAMAQDAKRFVELQGNVSMQGPLAGRVMALSSDAQDMDAITAKITPQMRQPGSGATSDFDAKMFQMATVSRTKNEGANKAIAEGVVLNAQVTQEREQFMRDYLTANGHLDGADRQWKRYADSNPIFDPASPKTPAMNPARVPYQQFFSGQQAPGANPAAPAPAAKGWKIERVN